MMNYLSIQQRQKIIVSLLILFGIFLRFVGISTDSLSFDEVATFVISDSSVTDIITMKYFDLANPPLYYFLMKSYVWNISQWTPITELILRLPSFIVSCFSIFLFSYLAKKSLSSFRAYSIALFLYVTSLPLIHFSQIARAYAVQQFLTILLFSVTFDFFKQPKSLTLLSGIIITAALLIYTHYSSVILLTGYFISLAIISWVRFHSRNEIVKIVLSCIIVVWFCIPLIVLQLYPAIFSPLAFEPKTAWGYVVPSLFTLLDYLLSGILSGIPNLPETTLWPILIFASLCFSIYVFLRKVKNDTQIGYLTFICILLVSECLLIALPSTRAYFFNLYYYLFLCAPFFIWIGYFSQKSRTFLYVLVILWISLMAPALYRHYKVPHEIQFRDATSSLWEIGALKTSRIVLQPCMISVPMQRYYATEYSFECFSDTIPYIEHSVFAIILVEKQSDLQVADIEEKMKQNGYVLENSRKHGGLSVLKFVNNIQHE